MKKRRQRSVPQWVAYALVFVAGVGSMYALQNWQQLYNATQPGMLAAVSGPDIIMLTNFERAHNSFPSLSENKKLDAAAAAKAADMANKGYFAHVGPGGKEPWAWMTEEGYAYRFAGENLAVRFTSSQDVVAAWMNSPTHRANILKSQYTEIGLGVATGTYDGQPATYIVQYFGTPQNAAPATVSSGAVSKQGAAVVSAITSGKIDSGAASAGF